MTDNDYDDIVDYGLDDVSLDDQHMESVGDTAEAEQRGGDALDASAGSGMNDDNDDAPASTTAAAVLAELPTDNELQLSQRVLDLERERDLYAARIAELEARYPAHSTTIPVPDAAANAPAGTAEPSRVSAPSAPSPTPIPTPTSTPAIPVPPTLLPVFAVLRQHIRELSRENAALRHTLLGSSSATMPAPSIHGSPASSMATTPLPAESPPVPIEVTPPTDSGARLPNPLAVPSASATPQLGHRSSVGGVGGGGGAEPDVDLAAVVAHVRTLMIENDELGDMVAAAGQADGGEWLKTLDDSKAVIASLDSDLTHNLGVIQALRTELDAYKARHGPLDGPGAPVGTSGGGGGLGVGARRPGSGGGSDRVPTPLGGQRGGGGRGNDRRRNGGGGPGGGGGGPPTGPRAGREPSDRYRLAGDDRDRDTDRDRDRRDNRDRDRDRDRDRRDDRDPRWGGREKDERDRGGGRRGEDKGGGGGGGGAAASGGGGGAGLSILGRAAVENGRGSGGGSRRGEDDRASKRRR